MSVTRRRRGHPLGGTESLDPPPEPGVPELLDEAGGILLDEAGASLLEE